MNIKIISVLLIVSAFVTGYFYLWTAPAPEIEPSAQNQANPKAYLSPEAYHVMYEAGTEAPFTSSLLEEHRKGTFVTADTGLPVFRSEDKYDSGTGWPSFVKPIAGSVIEKTDNSLLLSRTEIVSADTGAHLGHVFDDGPADRGGKRYCMNGIALRFIPDTVQ